MSRNINFGVIGCGLIGKKRIQAGCKIGTLRGVADVDLDRAKQFEAPSVRVYQSWHDLVSSDEIDAVIIATRHDLLAEISTTAINHSKHVFVEKPGARSVNELLEVSNALKNAPVTYRVGYNHRFHRSAQKAKSIIDNLGLGKLMFVRGRYGHGGRIGYDKEWRANPAISGGGELIDQGVHLIDLSRWFLGNEFVSVNGSNRTYFWDMPVEDNVFMLLESEKSETAFLHASCTEWKNLFSMEVYGETGKLTLEGLGGSYGTETLKWYKMSPEMGPPVTECWEYPMADNSWQLELQSFFDDIASDATSGPNIHDAIQNLEVVRSLYETS